MREEIYSLLEKWPERKIDSKKFNEVFQVDGIPLWYFLEPLIKSQACLPKPFRSLARIEEEIKINKTPSSLETLKFVALRKGLAINEKIKLWISKSRKEFEKTGDRDVLFIAYTNQILKKPKKKLELLGFGDVVNTLKESGVKPLVLICDPFSKNSFFGLRKFDNLLYSYVDSNIIRESRKSSLKLAQKWRKLEKTNFFTFQGKNYWKFLKNEMNFLFSREVLFTLIKYYLTFKKIIGKHDIRLVYLTGLIGFYESAILGAACKLDKKIVYSPHGYGGYIVPLRIREELLKHTLFAASGGEEKKKLLKLGIKAKNIFLTGSPFFDKIAEYKSQEIKKKTEKTVTLLPTALVEHKFIEKNEYFNYIRRYLMQISKVKNVKKVIIKLHPAEKYKSEYESIVKSLKLINVEIVQRPEKEFLYSVLRDSDLLISFGSTTDIEGLMLDKDVIVIEGFMGESHRRDLYKEAVVQVERDDDLTGIIDKVLNDKKLHNSLKQKRGKYLKKAFYKINGKAHERVANLIVSLIKKG